MKGIDLIKYIYDNKLTDADIVIGVEGYICDGIANDEQIQIRKMEDGRVLVSDHCGEYEQHFKAKEYYKIKITETYEKEFVVLAESESEAQNIAQYAYDSGDVDTNVEYDNPTNWEVECVCEATEDEVKDLDEIEEDE